MRRRHPTTRYHVRDPHLSLHTTCTPASVPDANILDLTQRTTTVRFAVMMPARRPPRRLQQGRRLDRPCVLAARPTAPALRVRLAPHPAITWLPRQGLSSASTTSRPTSSAASANLEEQVSTACSGVSTPMVLKLGIFHRRRPAPDPGRPASSSSRPGGYRGHARHSRASAPEHRCSYARCVGETELDKVRATGAALGRPQEARARPAARCRPTRPPVEARPGRRRGNAQVELSAVYHSRRAPQDSDPTNRQDVQSTSEGVVAAHVSSVGGRP